ncbi:energy transducer TonB [Brevundimonas sp. P7753]|jgi:TonB family protein|uniref:energy transducer TonB family protein n=1 Tax=Brevundimonas sp. P7753 TaxID=2726982 RepID=UPI0015BA8BDA|nr:energy transducer TonB [Brevundimonas sp. P7753]MBD3832525.1 energy transducer TonB [Brevundimonas sp.]NWE51063.1 energy transducer TonB [Brevundimonas sp. P7753]
MTMIIIALAAALMLDASPKLETVAKLTAREAPAQENYAAPILAVAVTLECTARATGQVENCRVLGETHPGLGFGAAAVALMRDATVEPGDEDFQFARTIQFTP